MAINAALVKELRDRTGSGMMECKKALQETSGDIEAAVEHLRKAGLAKAEKKAGRAAAEGIIVISQTDRAIAMAEVNCETDFVTKNSDFQDFADAVAERVREQAPPDLDELSALLLENGKSVDETRRELVSRIGENISVRRFVRFSSDDGVLNGYVHGGRIGVIVELEGGDVELAKDVAMHIAASRPICIGADQVPPELLAKEREIFAAQATAEAEASGKPAHVVEKMVTGRLRKFIEEVTLLGQTFVKDTSQSVEKLLKAHGAKVVRFERFELGEGIEKKTANFAEEVMAQVHGS